MLHEEYTHTLPYKSEGAMDLIFTLGEKSNMTLKCTYSRFMINHTDCSELPYLYNKNNTKMFYL